MFTKNNFEENSLVDAVKKVIDDAESIDESKITHILSKSLVSDHKRWMDSEGFDTKTKPLPKSHPKHDTHVGIVSKDSKESSYHEDGFAKPIDESVEVDEADKHLAGYGKSSERSVLDGNRKATYNKPTGKEMHPGGGYGKSSERSVLDDNRKATYNKPTGEMHPGSGYGKSSERSVLDGNRKATYNKPITHYESIDEVDNLALRGLHTANPQSIPSYMRSTEKGKKSLADKNKPILKDLIKRQLGKHPKPKLPEEVESIDELSKGTLMSYLKKGEKEQGKNFDDILAAHRANDQPKANKANAKYLKRNAGLDRAVDKMYSKYDKKTEEETFAQKLLKTIKENKGNEPKETFTDNNMGEEMSEKQKAKREKIVMSMKDKEKEFKDRYGKNWKNVMYATATKQAMKEEKEEEMLGKDSYGGKKPEDGPARKTIKGHEVNPKEYEDRLDKKHGKPGPYTGSVREEEEKKRMLLEPELDETGFHKAAHAARKAGQSHFEFQGKKYPVTSKSSGMAKEEKVIRTKRSTDTLAGPVPGGKDNEHRSYKVALEDEKSPESRAKSLAILAFRKIKKESMMGKIGTSEEKKK